MCDHTETEHQNNCVHIKLHGAGYVENVKNSVVNKVDYQGVDRGADGFAQTDKYIVDYHAARIGKVERHKFYYDKKYFFGVFKVLTAAEKRCPQGNGDYPQCKTQKGDKVII